MGTFEEFREALGLQQYERNGQSLWGRPDEDQPMVMRRVDEDEMRSYDDYYNYLTTTKDAQGRLIYGTDMSSLKSNGATAGTILGQFDDVELNGEKVRRVGAGWQDFMNAGEDFARVINSIPEERRGGYDEGIGYWMPVDVAQKVEDVSGARKPSGFASMMNAFSQTIGLAMGISNVAGAFLTNAAAGGSQLAASLLPEGGWQSLPSSLMDHAAQAGGSFTDITNALTGGGTALTGDAAAAASTGAGGAAANATGLSQMAADAGLSGAAADSFVSNGGLIGGTGATVSAAGGAVGSVLGGGDAEIIDSVNQWMSDNGIFTDATLEGAQFNTPAVSGGSITPFARDVADPVSDTARRARELLGDQAPAPVSSATPSMTGRTGAGGVMGWIEANPNATRALLTGGLAVAGGIGTAMINRGTLERQAELNREGARDILDTRQRNAAENAFTGTVGVRPAASEPLRRLSTRAPVYNGGLIAGVRR